MSEFAHIVARGSWRRDQIGSREVASTRRIDPAVEQIIEERWNRSMQLKNKKLFDGPMCRLERLVIEPDYLQFDWSPTSYRISWGTNLNHARQFPLDVRANPIGVSTIIASADDFLLLGKRNDRVAYHPNRVHPYAGSLEPPEAGDPFASSLREVWEELNVGEDELVEHVLIGIVEDQELRQSELIFFARSQLDRAGIEARLDAQEHDSVWSMRATREAIEEALQDVILTPVAQGALMLTRDRLDSQKETRTK